MIPDKKKSPEEIAALREGMGVPPPPAQPEKAPAAKPTMPPASDPAAAPLGAEAAMAKPVEAVIQLDIAPIPSRVEAAAAHRLRKHDLPLAPAPPVPAMNKTALPAHRHDPRDIAQIRKREALAQLQNPGSDPASHLRRQTAHPLLYAPGYLLALAAAACAYQRTAPITPIVLLALSLAVSLYIAMRKPRSRHHAALIFMLVFLTSAFGLLHYAPLFQNGP
ncbi:hypothetical protein HZ994_18260 [Akkermansiaceae bacterium]|nr:hypothetical protein HZ994_18260 [Akkermansiaceae bacterium]